MSKFEWKELPDWTNREDYMFLEALMPEAWAWEFLRRKPEYRADWDRFALAVKKAKVMAGNDWQYSQWVMHYEPAKLDEDEQESAWIARIVLGNGPEPMKTPINQYLEKKWGLNCMAPYDQPYEGVSFSKEVSLFPRLIRDEDSLLLLTEERGPEQGEAAVVAVRPKYALVAFDLTAHLGPQILKAKELLDQQYGEMKKYEKIQRSTIPKLITDHLVRHLRVLDAKRTNPHISHADLARLLGYDEEKGSKTASQQGSRWLNQAETARDDYQNFLIA